MHAHRTPLPTAFVSGATIVNVDGLRVAAVPDARTPRLVDTRAHPITYGVCLWAAMVNVDAPRTPLFVAVF